MTWICPDITVQLRQFQVRSRRQLLWSPRQIFTGNTTTATRTTAQTLPLCLNLYTHAACTTWQPTARPRGKDQLVPSQPASGTWDDTTLLMSLSSLRRSSITPECTDVLLAMEDAAGDTDLSEPGRRTSLGGPFSSSSRNCSLLGPSLGSHIGNYYEDVYYLATCGSRWQRSQALFIVEVCGLDQCCGFSSPCGLTQL